MSGTPSKVKEDKIDKTVHMETGEAKIETSSKKEKSLIQTI